MKLFTGLKQYVKNIQEIRSACMCTFVKKNVYVTLCIKVDVHTYSGTSGIQTPWNQGPYL